MVLVQISSRNGESDRELPDMCKSEWRDMYQRLQRSNPAELIAEIQSMKAGDPLFDAKVTVLGEYVDHHVQEEESEMFPESRDSDLDLKALGAQMAERKAQLMEQAGA